MKNYSIDANNNINYEIIDDFVIIKFLHFSDSNNLFNNIKHYFDYFRDNFTANFLASYPGTCNPMVVKAHLDVVKLYAFNYRLYYDSQEVLDKQEFENNILNQYLTNAPNFSSEQTQSACAGTVGVHFQNSGFKLCSICSPLRNSIDVKSPIKYYKIDPSGYLIAEYDEKPNETDNFWQSIRLKDKFTTRLIKIENGKCIYYPKPVN